MRPHLPEIRRLGADLAIIGSGDPASAKAFQEDLEIRDVPVFSDEPRRAYELAGFCRGLLPLLRPRAVGNYLRAFFSGHRAGRKQGDALQQGGVLVVRRDGGLLFRFASRASGDHPDAASILEALRAGEEPRICGIPSEGDKPRRVRRL